MCQGRRGDFKVGCLRGNNRHPCHHRESRAALVNRHHHLHRCQQSLRKGQSDTCGKLAPFLDLLGSKDCFRFVLQARDKAQGRSLRTSKDALKVSNLDARLFVTFFKRKS
jgi:hypothetical protein